MCCLSCTLQPDALFVIVPALALPTKLAAASYILMFVLGTVAAMGAYTGAIGELDAAVYSRCQAPCYIGMCVLGTVAAMGAYTGAVGELDAPVYSCRGKGMREHIGAVGACLLQAPLPRPSRRPPACLCLTIVCA